MAAANPFRALNPFGRGERLFGRDGDLTLFLDRLLTRRTTLLFAASGAGKTSFLNAPVVSDLEDRFFVTIHSQWSAGNPLNALMESVEGAWLASPWSANQPLPARPDSLAALYRMLAPEQPWTGCVLILDQFEEVFQQHSETRALADLVNAIAALIAMKTPEVRVVISMREEFLGELSIFDNKVPDLFNNYYRLKYPNRRQAKGIILSTVEAVDVKGGRDLDPLMEDLVTAARPSAMIRGELLRDSVPPPFLQIACKGLWDGAPPEPGGSFPAAYQAGDAYRELNRYCERVLSRLSRQQKDDLAEALGFLITRRGAKVAYDVSALAHHSEIAESRLRDVLDRLSAPDVKLFRRSQAADGATWYELYHDMYSPFLTSWTTEHQKQQRAERHRRLIGAAALLVIVAGGALLWASWKTNRLQHRLAEARIDQINTPVEQYRLRFDPHTDRVMDVTFSPDGTQAASVAFDGKVKVWRVAEAYAVRTFSGNGGLHAVAFRPGSAGQVAYGGADADVTVRDTASAKVTENWKFGKAVYALAFDASGRRVACAGDGNQLKVWDLEDHPTQVFNWPNAVNSVVFLKDGRQLVLGDFGGRVAVLDTSDGSSKVLRTHELSVLGVAVSPDEKWVASGSRDMTIGLDSRETGETKTLKGHTAAVRAVSFSPDGKLLASAGVDGTVRLWDVKTGAQVATLLGHFGTVYAVAFDPKGGTLVTSGQDSTIRLWSVAERRQIGTLSGDWVRPSYVQFSGDLSRVVLAGTGEGSQVWNGGALQFTRRDAEAAALSRDGRTLAMGTSDGSVWLGVDRMDHPSLVTRMSAPVRRLVFSADGNTIAMLDDQERIRIADLKPDDTGRPKTSDLQSRTGSVQFLAMSDNGASIAVAGSGGLTILDRVTGAARVVNTTNAVRGIAYNVFGELMILYADGSVEMLAGGRPRTIRLRDAAPLSSVAAASEDGKSFAFADDKGEVRVWRTATAEPVSIQVGTQLLRLEFARDASRLGTIDLYGNVRVYRVGEPASGSSGGSW